MTIRSLMSAAAALVLSAGVAQAAPLYKVIGHIPGPDGRWDYATFDPVSRRIFVAKGDSVMMADADTGTIKPDFARTGRSHIVLPLPDGHLLVTDGGPDKVFILDAGGKTLAEIPTGKGPDGALYDPASGLAFVADHAGGQVTIIDPKTRSAVGVVDVGGKALEFLAVDGKGRLWVNDEDAGEVAAIDVAKRQVIARHKLGCEGPTGLIYAPAAGRLIASCDKVAAVIDPATGQVVDRLPIGDGADAVIYDAARKLAFVPAGESGTLTVIDASMPRLKVLQTVKTAPGARTGTLDPKTGKLYLPTAKRGPKPATGRAPLLPGSFELLVVGP